MLLSDVCFSTDVCYIQSLLPTGACSLKHLVHLSLSNNLIPTLAPLYRSPLRDLKYLNISGNCLTSLNGIEECVSLVELYAGNNKITSIREILSVKVCICCVTLCTYVCVCVEVYVYVCLC